MQIHQFDDVQAFWQQTQDYLLRYEAEHNALIGVVHTLLHHPERYPELPYLAIAQVNNDIQAIAIRTPPNHLLLSKAQDLASLNCIAQGLQHEQLPGVSGLVAEVEAFAQAWQKLTTQSYQRGVECRIYQLTEVEFGTTVKGNLRLATQCDRPLLLRWFTAFNSEIYLVTDSEIERRVEVELKRQSLYLWEDGGPVSMVGGRQFSPTAARIAPVYTPPEHRHKGYATACVAAVSQELLNQGSDRCFLFADLANPTSNSIYQKVGYRPVCDWHECSFSHG